MLLYTTKETVLMDTELLNARYGINSNIDIRIIEELTITNRIANAYEIAKTVTVNLFRSAKETISSSFSDKVKNYARKGVDAIGALASFYMFIEFISLLINSWLGISNLSYFGGLYAYGLTTFGYFVLLDFAILFLVLSFAFAYRLYISFKS